jgi:hypothetical protein
MGSKRVLLSELESSANVISCDSDRESFSPCPFRKSLGETLAKEGIDVKQLSAGEGGRREVVQTVHQGRRGSISMVGSNRRRSVVGPVDDGEAKEVEQQDIGGLISRLKNTITSDAEKREPSKIPLRKGDDLKTEGVKVMDAKQLATTTGEKVKKNQGRSVPQDAVRRHAHTRAQQQQQQHCWQHWQPCRLRAL